MNASFRNVIVLFCAAVVISQLYFYGEDLSGFHTIRLTSSVTLSLKAQKLGMIGGVSIIELAIHSGSNDPAAQLQFKMTPGIKLLDGETERKVELRSGSNQLILLRVRIDGRGEQKFSALLCSSPNPATKECPSDELILNSFLGFVY